MNFYQNQIRKSVSKDVFKKDIFDIIIFGKKYWGIKKTHKKFGIKLYWYQVLGIEIPENISNDQFKYEIDKLKQKFKSWNNIFFQLGFITNIKEPFYENRQIIKENFKKNYGLESTIKENMPEATIIVDLTKTEEELYRGFSKSSKRNINKSIKNGLYFKVANQEEIEDFYDIWYQTAQIKGFNIYPKKDYIKLINFLKATGSGDLYIVKKDNIIVGGSIEITENKYSYYLYGATNRKFTKIGGHYFLKYEMFKYLKKKGVEKVDLLGVAPLGYEENHHLFGVSQFKNSLGGERIEYIGNFDIPLNYVIYKIIRLKNNKLAGF